MADGDGYPTDEELARIEAWRDDDLLGWFAYIKAAGNYWPTESFGWSEFDGVDDLKRPIRVYLMSTGGWSGNEDILDAMRKNWMCWHQTWYEHRRGGHYAFRVEKKR